jgi:hypothetical protein
MSAWSVHLGAIDAASTAKVGPATSKLTIKQGELSYLRVKEQTPWLHAQSKLDRNMYSTARCVASEVGVKAPSMALLSVAECIRNEAKERGVEPYALLAAGTSAAYAWTKGMYGEQHGRWASTGADPHGRSVAAAMAGLIGGSNVTNNGRRWVDCALLDKGTQNGRTVRPAHEVCLKWGAEGWQWIGPLPNVDPYQHAVMRFVGKNNVNTQAMLTMIDAGRANETQPGQDETDKKGVPWWLWAASGAIILV